MQCELENQVKAFADSVTAIDFKEVNKQQIAPIPEFNESIGSVLSTNKSDSLLGEMVGASLTGAVSGLVQKVVPLPIVGTMGSLVTAIVGYLLMTKVFKSGFGHAASRGVIVGAGATAISPWMSGLTASITGA